MGQPKLKLVGGSENATAPSSVTVATSADELTMILEDLRGLAEQAIVAKEAHQTTTTIINQQRKEIPIKPVLTGPVLVLNKLLDVWRLNREEACFLLGFGVDQGEYVDSILDGFEPLRSIDERSRITHLFKIRAQLDSLFRNEDGENKWLRETQPTLNNQTPLEVILSGSMENLLLVRQFVDHISGH